MTEDPVTEDPALAFGPLTDRAAALSPALDRIALTDHIVRTEIGAFQEERGQEQRLRVAIVVEVAPQDGPVADNVDRILSYDLLAQAVAAELAAERLNLLETLAERVAARILAHPRAARVFLRIEKLDRGPGALGVEIVRDRAVVPVALPAPPRPRVVWIGREAAEGTDLGARIAALGAPLILTVAPEAAPRAAHPLAQRRIDLLALEQAAWVLAARHPDWLVIDSRTEIDHALRAGQTLLWAPSRIVLDAADGPGPEVWAGGAVAASLALAHWLGGLVAARDLVTIGPAPVLAAPRLTVRAA